MAKGVSAILIEMVYSRAVWLCEPGFWKEQVHEMTYSFYPIIVISAKAVYASSSQIIVQEQYYRSSKVIRDSELTDHLHIYCASRDLSKHKPVLFYDFFTS